MIEFLQKYRCLVDTNVWLQAKFRSTVEKSAPLLRQLRVPYLVNQELKTQQNDDELRNYAAAALKFISKHKIEILPTPTVSHHADREIIICCMENAGAGMALITNDRGLKEDLKEFSPKLLTLGWDIEKGIFSVDNAPGYESLTPSYNTILAGPGVAQRADFPLRMVQLRCAGIKEVLKPAGSLLARAMVHDGNRRALLLLKEGDDSAPYEEFRNKKLRSVDNTGFDIAFMDADGRIEVYQPQGSPLPKRQEKPAKTKQTATSANNSDCTAKEFNEKLTEHLKDRKFAAACELLDKAENERKPLPRTILNSYLNKVLGELAEKKDWKTLMTRFTGKEGKKAFRRLIELTYGTNTVGIVRPKLNAWRKHCETDAQRKAIDSIIDAAQKKN